MKSFTLGLVVAMGLLGIGCSADDEEQSAAPEQKETMHLASSLERKLTAPIAVPSDSPIGGSIDALVEAHTEATPADPVVNLGANGKRCTFVRFSDENGAEIMRREQCGTTDLLRVGKLVYTDQNGDGKIDQFSDQSTASYDLYDDDRDGKLDRMVESPEHIKAPITLTDFAAKVTITAGGKIASRERLDRDHDGKFDVELVTATTSFQVASSTETSQSQKTH